MISDTVKEPNQKSFLYLKRGICISWGNKKALKLLTKNVQPVSSYQHYLDLAELLSETVQVILVFPLAP